MQTTKLLKELEWSSWRETAPGCMGGFFMGRLPCCPICKGVKPSEMAKTEFISDAIGHRKKCELARAIEEATK